MNTVPDSGGLQPDAQHRAPDSSRSGNSGNLPVVLTSFVGREEEIALALSLLKRPDVRLLTLTGPGGIGKTRLAIEIAASHGDVFPDGVIFVALASIQDASMVLGAVAAALGTHELDDASNVEGLALTLGMSEMLLIVDNFEHVLDAAPSLTRLLARCPNLKIIVTSRSLLRVEGEHALPVPPLALPQTTSAMTETDWLQVPVIKLFRERAQAVNPALTWTESDVQQIVDICNRLDGLPLAVELAATRVRHLTLSGIRDRLNDSLPLLIGGSRDQPSRLQTMRNAIVWSHDLLPRNVQILFRDLAVFRGGFTLQGVESVSAFAEAVGSETSSVDDVSRPVDDDAPSNIRDCLLALIDASLLVRSSRSRSGGTRYRLLETIREYASTQLASSGYEEIVRNRHASWCIALAESFGAGGAFGIREDTRWVSLAEADHDNVRAALAWLERSGNGTEMLRLAIAIQPLWEVRGYHTEAIGWFTRGLAIQADVSATIRLSALEGFGRHLERQGRYDLARSRFEEALALARELDDPRSTAQALYALGAVATNQEQYARASQFFVESLAVFQHLGDAVMIGGAHYFLSIIAYGQGDFAGATTEIEIALAAQQSFGQSFNRAIFLTVLGLLQSEQRNAGAAVEALAESRAIMQTGQPPSREVVAEWLAAVARFAVCLKRHEQAARLYGAAESLTEASGVPLVVPPRAHYLRTIDQLSRDLSTPTFRAAWSAGRSLSLEQAVTEARGLIEDPAVSGAQSPAESRTLSLLTPREREILNLIVLGQTDPQIAETLFISVRTVENHVARVLAKLGARTRTAAVSMAIAAGFVASPPA